MMTIETPLAKELTGFQNPDDRFLALIRNDDDLDPTFLDVKYCIGRLTLGKDDLILREFRYRFATPTFARKFCGSNGSLPELSAIACSTS